MGIRRPPPDGVEVEEVRVDEWGLPPAPGGPSTAIDEGAWSAKPPVDRARRWFSGRWKPIAAVVAALVVIGAIVATATSSAPNQAAPTTSTAAPSTTAPRAIPTAPPSTTLPASAADPATDMRALLLPIPQGFGVEFANVEPSPGGSSSGRADEQLFAAPGATWATGPWVLILEGFGPIGVWFDRPPIVSQINGVVANTGSSSIGDEMTSLDLPSGTVLVVTEGLPAGSSATIAASVSANEGVISVPAAALPGVGPVDGVSIESWLGGFVGSANYSRSDGATIGLSVRPSGVDASFAANAQFFLTDLQYAVIDGSPAFVGAATTDMMPPGFQMIVWQRAGRELHLLFHGITVDEALGIATSVVLPTDDRWAEGLWSAALDAMNRGLTTGTGTSTPLDVSAVDSGTWQGQLWPRDGSVGWGFNNNQQGIGGEAPLTLPLLQVAASAFQPDGGAIHLFAGAVAIVDSSMAGATLRLTSSGAAGRKVEAPLEPLGTDDPALAGCLAVGVAMPWDDGGFTAELVAADGTIIATASDADVP